MSLLHLFNQPIPAAALLALAFLGLAIEVRSEGFHKAGWAGLLALGLFLVSHIGEGTAPWTTLPVLAGVGVLWPALEDPRRRVAAGLGVLLIAVGAFVVMVAPGHDRLDFARALAVLLAASFLVMIVAGAVWYRLPATVRPEHRTDVFFFEPDEAAPEAERVVVGARGTAVSPVAPGGWALIDGERMEVVTEDEWLEEGDLLEVVGQEGVHLYVRALPSGSPPG